MNFKRVEIILIIAFLLVDIFLLITFFNRADINYATNGNETINLVQEMQSQGIDLPPLMDEVIELPYVQADAHNLLEENADQLSDQTGTVNQNGSLYSSILSNPIVLSGEETLTEEDRSRLDAFMGSGQVLFGENYSFFQYRPAQQVIIYNQSVEGVQIADGTSSVILYLDSSGQVISYEQTYAGPVSEQGSSLTLITDETALELLYQNNEIPGGAAVSAPTLTYYRTLTLEDLSMYAPVWYIEIETNSGTESIRVDAVNGSIITDLPVDPAPSNASEEDEETTDTSDTSDTSASLSPQTNSAAR